MVATNSAKPGAIVFLVSAGLAAAGAGYGVIAVVKGTSAGLGASAALSSVALRPERRHDAPRPGQRVRLDDELHARTADPLVRQDTAAAGAARRRLDDVGRLALEPRSRAARRRPPDATRARRAVARERSHRACLGRGVRAPDPRSHGARRPARARRRREPRCARRDPPRAAVLRSRARARRSRGGPRTVPGGEPGAHALVDAHPRARAARGRLAARRGAPRGHLRADRREARPPLRGRGPRGDCSRRSPPTKAGTRATAGMCVSPRAASRWRARSRGEALEAEEHGATRAYVERRTAQAIAAQRSARQVALGDGSASVG